MGSFLRNARKNWKTTSLGAVGAVLVFVSTAPGLFGGEGAPLVQVSRALLATGVLGIGAVATDPQR